MSYGFSIWNRNNTEVTGILSPIFFLDRFDSRSGSKTYHVVPPGKKLKAIYYHAATPEQAMDGASAPNISVSDNTVTWSDLDRGLGSFIYTFWI